MNLNEMQNCLLVKENWKDLYIKEQEKNKLLTQQNRQITQENEELNMENSKLLSVMQEMKSLTQEQQNEIQQKSGTIKLLNEKIGMLYEADNILEENKDLKKKMAYVEEEAAKKISVAKTKYENKLKELETREQVIKNGEAEIENKITQNREDIEHQYIQKIVQKENELQEKYDMIINKYYAKYYAFMFYSIVTFLATILKSEAIKYDFLEVLKGIKSLTIIINNICSFGANKFNFISPSHEILNLILNCILYMFCFIIIAGLLSLLIFITVNWLSKFWNFGAMLLMIISCCIIFNFADGLREAVNINLFFILFVIYLIYVTVRKIFRDC